jgi:hypothetical protein
VDTLSAAFSRARLAKRCQNLAAICARGRYQGQRSLDKPRYFGRCLSRTEKRHCRYPPKSRWRPIPGTRYALAHEDIAERPLRARKEVQRIDQNFDSLPQGGYRSSVDTPRSRSGSGRVRYSCRWSLHARRSLLRGSQRRLSHLSGQSDRRSNRVPSPLITSSG